MGPAPAASRRLHVGCGTRILPGWISLDVAALPGVDVVHDLDDLPLPFESGSMEEVLAEDVLEHVGWVPVLRDLHRILAPGGRITIRVPHFTSRDNFVDPTHRARFSARTFDPFAAGTPLRTERPYYFDFSFARIVRREITFLDGRFSRLLSLNGPVRRWVNRRPENLDLYEVSGLSRLFPAQNVVVVLEK